MAAGAGLAVLATAGTATYLLVAYVYPEITRRLPRPRGRPVTLRVTYLDGRGILRDVLASSTDVGFAVADLTTHHVDGDARAIAVQLELRGNGSVTDLASELDGIEGVLAVSAADPDERDGSD
jgi:putative Mg2+ transporter-C (MgtC) family protein